MIYKIELPAEVLEAILQALSHFPYREAEPVIQLLKRQRDEQDGRN